MATTVPYRLITAKTGRDVRVWLDGEEVTDRCMRALVAEDGTPTDGFVQLLRINAKGKFLVREINDGVLSDWWTGTVRWEKGG